MKLRSITKTAISYGLYRTGAAQLRDNIPGAKRMPLVLGLHRVVENFEASAKIHMPSMLISTSRLEQYLDWIAQRYRFVGLEEAIDGFARDRASDRPVATVTFDDGYRDIYYNAFPLLKRKRIPFAVFVISDLIGTNHLPIYDELFLLLKRARVRWGNRRGERLVGLLDELGISQRSVFGTKCEFDQMRMFLNTLPQRKLLQIIKALRDSVGRVDDVAPNLRSLTWEMIKEMQNAGVTIGSHTRSHAILTRETRERILAELNGSKRAMESVLGTEIKYFAYPNGDFNESVVREVQKAGYQAAYTTDSYLHPSYVTALTIPRRMLWENACVNTFGRPSRAVLECFISGMFDGLNKSEAEHEA